MKKEIHKLDIVSKTYTHVNTLIVLSAVLGCAKEKLKDDSSYEFRLVFAIKNKISELSQRTKSSRLPLLEGIMNFRECAMSFIIQDKDTDALEITMAIGNEKVGRKFKPNYFQINQLKMNEEILVIWELNSKSQLALKYKLTSTMDPSRNSTDFIKIPSEGNIANTNNTVVKNRIDFFERKSKTFQLEDFNFVQNTSSIHQKTNLTTISSGQLTDSSQALSKIINEMSNQPKIKEMFLVKSGECPANKKLNPNFHEIKRSYDNSKIIQTEINNTLSMRNKFIDTPVKMKNMTSFLQSVEKVIEEKEENQIESFCEGFFICSFPYENAKVIENSENYPGSCGHPECSLLPALQPEIMARFPLKDTKTLELNNLAATICFPSGVKVCYYQDAMSKKTVKNYSTPITNQQGDRYYMMTYHYYNKMVNCVLSKRYTMHPLRAYLKKLGQEGVNMQELYKKNRQKLEQDIAICGELGFQDFVYIPFCACLISKYPYIRQMEKCIEAILRIAGDKKRKPEEAYELILFLTRGVPIPPMNSMIKFYIPNCPSPIELIGPVYQDVNLINNNLRNLLKLFSIENIITIFRLMLFEQKILFVDAEYNRLSEVTDSFISLLYPLQWIHTYIPIMSQQMIKYLQAFMPFVNGINESLMQFAQPILHEAESGVYVVYINKNYIDISTNRKGKKIKIKDYITVPELPGEIAGKLSKALKELKANLEKNSGKNLNIYAVDMYIKNTFTNVFVELLYDYMSYLCHLDDYSVFNAEMMIENRPRQYVHFYQEFTETQLFQQFVQNILNDGYDYFNQMINQKEKGKGKGQKTVKRSNSITGRRTSCGNKNVKLEIKDIFLDSCSTKESTTVSPKTQIPSIQNKYFDIDQIYVITPYFLQWDQASLAELEQFLADAYDHTEDTLNENRVLNESMRVFEIAKTLNLADANKEFKRYIIPGQAAPTKKLPKFFNPIKIAVATSKIILNRVNMFEEKSKDLLQKKPTYLKAFDTILTDKEKNSIKEEIKDILGRIFQSDKVNESDLQNVLSLIEGNFGRDFFAKIISQSMIKKKHIKTISSNGYELLNKILFNALIGMLKIDENTQNLEHAVRMTNASFLYYKLAQDKSNYFLYVDLIPKLQNFAMWLKDNFWAKWFEICLKESTELDDPKSKDIKEHLSQDELCYNILIEMTNKMKTLQLGKEYIYKCIIGLSDHRIKNPVTAEKLSKDICEVIAYSYSCNTPTTNFQQKI